MDTAKELSHCLFSSCLDIPTSLRSIASDTVHKTACWLRVLAVTVASARFDFGLPSHFRLRSVMSRRKKNQQPAMKVMSLPTTRNTPTLLEERNSSWCLIRSTDSGSPYFNLFSVHLVAIDLISTSLCKSRNFHHFLYFFLYFIFYISDFKNNLWSNFKIIQLLREWM